jgi:YD repeat-containing protein
LPERPTIHSFRSEGIRLYEELNEECLDGFCIEYMEPEKSYVVTEKCYISGVDEPVHLRRTVYLSDGRSEDSSWTKEFDAMGNVIAFASSTGYAYRQRWDAAGNKIWFRDNEGKQQAWRYKGNGDYALVDSRYPKGIFPQQWSVTNRWPGMLWEEGDFQAVTLP